MKSSVAITVIIVGAVLILAPMLLSYANTGEPPENLFRVGGKFYPWCCMLSGITTIGIGIKLSLLEIEAFDPTIKMKSKGPTAG